MSVYISFYKALPININNKRQINIIRQKLIEDLRRRISNPIKSIGSKYNVFTEEIEASRIASIPTKKKHIKWLRKAKCKQIAMDAFQVNLWLYSNTLYEELEDYEFPINWYLTEDTHNVHFKNCDHFLSFMEKNCSTQLTSEHKLLFEDYFNKYGKAALIHVY